MMPAVDIEKCHATQDIYTAAAAFIDCLIYRYVELVLFKIILSIVLFILGLASVVAPKYCCKNKPFCSAWGICLVQGFCCPL